MLGLGLSAIVLLSVSLSRWLYVTNPTIIALTLLLVVLFVAAASTLRVAVTASIMAFVCFNYFFLPPVGTFRIADAQNWVALFSLLVVSVVGSQLSAQVRRRAEEAAALLEARKEAEVLRRAAELKSALLVSLGHDLKTPLTAVTVAANNLNATWLDDEQRREQAAIVRTELERLNRLFENIVDMARIETNAVAAEPEWVEPADIIDAAARQAERALEAHPLLVASAAERVLVRLDPRLTSAALGHLLENAAQYSPAGAAVDVRVALEPGGLQITVRDRGRGIAPEDLDHVFERFYRGADARRYRLGTGVGLAITRGLLAAEVGAVSARNHPEGGAEFTIAIPAETRAPAVLEGETL